MNRVNFGASGMYNHYTRLTVRNESNLLENRYYYYINQITNKLSFLV